MNHTKTLQQIRREWDSRLKLLGIPRYVFLKSISLTNSVWVNNDMKLSTMQKIEAKLSELENEAKNKN